MKKINVNGTWQQSACLTLEGLLIELNCDPVCVATAVDGDFVARDQRANVDIENGMRIEIVAPMQGG